ncbi:CLUMA_CG013781, isoform A [Clunio marinus]|uniref:CLUMA_CG013781, isoform A n=1 Tax=Clunio marinus TaxID=568069 RepID=A0A1J1IK04_9DIPT|nr:CLUMA_CG013781, isoform A [Clunio marinus]
MELKSSHIQINVDLSAPYIITATIMHNVMHFTIMRNEEMKSALILNSINYGTCYCKKVENKFEVFLSSHSISLEFTLSRNCNVSTKA